MSKRKKSGPKKGGADYWKKMQSARIYQGNLSFLQATAEMPFAFRLRFAWEIVKGINPATGKKA